MMFVSTILSRDCLDLSDCISYKITYAGSVLSAIITYGIRKQPIPPIPSITLRTPKKNVEDIKGETIADDETSNTEIKNADLRPQLSAIMPKMNAPISIPTMYKALKMPFK